jgi:alpha-tubulin suppressor-like RCC1 family protein
MPAINQPKVQESTKPSSSSINSNKSPLSNIVFSWGSGKDGRLGNGSERGEKYPFAIENFLFESVSAGYYHSAGLDDRGKKFLYQLFLWKSINI